MLFEETENRYQTQRFPMQIWTPQACQESEAQKIRNSTVYVLQ